MHGFAASAAPRGDPDGLEVDVLGGLAFASCRVRGLAGTAAGRPRRASRLPCAPARAAYVHALVGHALDARRAGGLRRLPSRCARRRSATARRRAQLAPGGQTGDAAVRDAARAQGVTDDALLDALLRTPRNDSEVVAVGRAATQIGVEELTGAGSRGVR